MSLHDNCNASLHRLERITVSRLTWGHVLTTSASAEHSVSPFAAPGAEQAHEVTSGFRVIISLLHRRTTTSMCGCYKKEVEGWGEIRES